MTHPLSPQTLIERLRGLSACESLDVRIGPKTADALQQAADMLQTLTDRITALEQENAKLNHWHRRAQKAEAELCVTAEERERQGQSIGRRLAGATWQHYKDRAEVAEAKVTALEQERDLLKRSLAMLARQQERDA